ncbi:MAG: sulfatase-like hydrolase/transferase [Deltaproteobacteria bacterium]|nr:sulfatase-like hydrolase/transferase [Deltaproteobacteria bacterium]
MTRFPRQSQRLPVLLGFGLAWVLLNLFLTIDFPLPSAFTFKPLLPSLDVWGLLLVLCFLAWRRVPFTARVYLPLIGLLVFGRLFRLGDVIMPVYFNRPFNLYMDVGYLPGLGHLLANSFSTLELALYGAIAMGLVAALLWLLWRGLRAAHVFFQAAAARRGFVALTIAMVLLLGAHRTGYWPRGLGPPAVSTAPRVAAEVAFIANIRQIRQQGLSAVQMAETAIPDYQAPLAGLNGRNVYLFLIESYGQTLFGNPAHRQAFARTLARWEADLHRGGYAVCSRYMRSPTFGGASWLAFGTLESGVWLPNQLRYGYLVASRVPPLANYFEKAGYRTVSVMPGTTMPWPEGRYFGYQKEYQARDLDYRGPAFGFAPMPDQFVLDRIYREEITQRAAPLFIRYVLVSTHAPFHRQPRFLADWDRIGDGRVYHTMDPIVFPNNWPDLTEAFGAYLTSIDTELTVLGDYLTRFDHGDALIIILGDHQPNAHITGPEAPSLVPVHVISRQASTLEPFRQMGFTPGVIPPDTPPFAGMQEFLPAFLAAYSR